MNLKDVYSEILKLTAEIDKQEDLKKKALCENIRDSVYAGLMKEGYPCKAAVIRGQTYIVFRINQTNYFCEAERLKECIDKYENVVRFTKVMSGSAVEDFLQNFEKDITRNALPLKEVVKEHDPMDVVDTIKVHDKPERYENVVPKSENIQKKADAPKQDSRPKAKKEVTEEPKNEAGKSKKEDYVQKKTVSQKENFPEPEKDQKQGRRELKKNEPKKVSKPKEHQTPTDTKANEEFAFESYRGDGLSTVDKMNKPLERHKEKTERAAERSEKSADPEKQAADTQTKQAPPENQKETDTALKEMAEMRKLFEQERAALEKERELFAKQKEELERSIAENKMQDAEPFSTEEKEAEEPASESMQSQTNIIEGSMPTYLSETFKENMANVDYCVSWDDGQPDNIEIIYDGKKTAVYSQAEDHSRTFHLPFVKADTEIKVVIYGTVSGANCEHTYAPATMDDLEETTKNLDELTYDTITARIKDLQGEEPDECNAVTIVPLDLSPEDADGHAVNSDIMVVMKTENGSYKVFTTEPDAGTKTVSISNGANEFLVRGLYKNNKFESSLYPQGRLSTERFMVDAAGKTEYRGNVPSFMRGHAYKRVKIDEEQVIDFHILPLSMENTDSGYASIAVCADELEYANGKENNPTMTIRHSAVTNSLDKVQITTLDGTYEVSGQWKRNEFKTVISKL